MTVFVISYDLRQPGRDYEKLFEKIKSLGTWWHCQTSTWMVVSDLTALQIATALWAVMDQNDRLLVNPVAPGSAWAGFDEDCVAWIKHNL